MGVGGGGRKEKGECGAVRKEARTGATLARRGIKAQKEKEEKGREGRSRKERSPR